jgi:hypothetical protein
MNLVKKISSKFLISFLVVVFVFSQAPAIFSANDEIDQYCSGPWSGWTKIYGHNDISQTFVPEHNRLTRMMLVLRGDGGGTVYIRLQKNATTIATASVSEPNGDETFVYADFDDVNLVVGDSYRIKLTTTDTEVGWYHSVGSGCCDSGSAYLDGTEKDYDWGFSTWGWTYTFPVEDPPEESGDQPAQEEDSSNIKNDYIEDQEGVTAGTGEEPSDLISTALNPPSNLTAVDLGDDQGGVIKLTWQKPDNNKIDGYLIFRSTDQDEGYKNIAKTEEDIVNFLDKEAVTNTSYYYLLRSYRNGKQSPDSNKVKATSIDNLSPQTPENFVVINQLEDRLIFSWDSNNEDDLAGYRLEVVEISRDENIEIPIEIIDIDADKSEYVLIYNEHDQVTSDNQDNIRYYLRAFDESENLSERAGPLSASAEEESTSRTVIWYISILALIVLLAILAGLIYWEKKNKNQVRSSKNRKREIDIKK